MKKFLVCLFVAVLVISAGFAIFFFVGNQERITLSASTLYTKVGDEFELGVNIQNRKKGTSLTVSSSNEEILAYDEGRGVFTAVSGGVARINVRTTNAKYKNLYCDVLVGDGSLEAPYYIDSAEKLALIGTNDEYTLNKNYKLMNDIDMRDVCYGYFRPLGDLAGRFDGNGYAIKNLYLNQELYTVNNEGEENYVVANWDNAGLFNSVLSTGAVYNLKVENFIATGEFNSIATICAYNYGVVERIEVLDAKFNVDANYIGGISAHNVSSLNAQNQTVARINRSSANLTIGYADEVVGTDAIVGGIVAENKGGILVYVYSTGKVALKDSAIFGGVAGVNEYVQLSAVYGGNIKDSYSVMGINDDLTNDGAIIGAIIGRNNDMLVSENVTANKIIGCYYNSANANGYDGVGKEYLANVSGVISEISKEDAKYYVQGYSASGLKNQNVLYSREVGDETKMWDFNNVWQIVSSKNNGYPVIDYSKISVDEDFSFNVVVEKSHTLTFEYNGATSGNTLASKEVVEGEVYGTLPTPSRIGYTFAGWYLENSFVNRIYSSSVVELEEDATIYAKWIENAPEKVEYVVGFEYNGATGSCSLVSKTVVDGEAFGTLPAPTKSGYTFGGWYLENTFVNRVYASTIVNLNCNIKLYAKWVENAPVYKDLTLTLKSNLPNNDYWVSNTYKNANYTFNFGSTLTSNEKSSAIKTLTVKEGSKITKSLKSNSNGVAVVEFTIVSPTNTTQTLTYTTLYNGYSNYSFVLNGTEYNSSSAMNAEINSNCELIAKYNYSGAGSTASPVQVSSLADWNNLVVCLSQKDKVNNNIYSFKQMQNLTIGSACCVNQVSVFYGNYDGNNKNITFNAEGSSMFVNVCGNVSNMKVIFNEGTADFNYFGGIAQCLAGGTISNSTVSGSITSGNIVGGIVGYVSTNSTISNVTNNATITINSDSTEYVGGIVGKAISLTLNASTNNGRINVTSAKDYVRVGGLLGFAKNSSISNSTSNASIDVIANGTSSNAYVGGFVGLSSNNITINGTSGAYSYNKGNITSRGVNGSYVGGIVGATSDATEAKLMCVGNKANLTSTQTKNTYLNGNGFAIAGGIVGYSNNKTTKISFASNDKNCVIRANSEYNNAHASNILALSNDSVQLYIACSVYEGKIIVNEGLNARSMYAGGAIACFDGAGYVELDNLSTELNKMNIKLSQNVATNLRYVGGLIGSIITTNKTKSSVIDNCINNTTLVLLNGGASMTYVGGLVGSVIAESTAPFIIKGNSKTIEEIDCHNCKGDLAVGGLVGYAKNINITSTIEASMYCNDLYRIYVTGTGTVYAGGVIGACTGTTTINSSSNNSKVRSVGDIEVNYNGTVYAGGLVGVVMNAGTLNIYKSSDGKALADGKLIIAGNKVYKNELYGARTSNSTVNVY